MEKDDQVEVQATKAEKLRKRLGTYLKKSPDKISMGIDLSSIAYIIILLEIIFSGAIIGVLIGFLYSPRIMTEVIIVLFPFFIPILGLLVISHVYFHKRKIEWVFDKSARQIINQKVSPTLKKIRTINFSQVKEIRYAPDEFGTYPVYYLEWIIKPNKRKKFFQSTKEECEALGKEISSFLKVPFIFRKYKTGYKFALISVNSFVIIMFIVLIILMISFAAVFIVSFIMVIGFAIIANSLILGLNFDKKK